MTVVAHYEAMLVEMARIQDMSDAELGAEREGDELSQFYVFRRLLIASGLPDQLEGAVKERDTLRDAVEDAIGQLERASDRTLRAASLDVRVHLRETLDRLRGRSAQDNPDERLARVRERVQAVQATAAPREWETLERALEDLNAVIADLLGAGPR